MFHILKYNDSENKCTNWRLSQYVKDKGTCEVHEKCMNWIRIKICRAFLLVELCGVVTSMRFFFIVYVYIFVSNTVWTTCEEFYTF